MGMKLKSGADLCGFELTNFCIQGLESMPSDAALGRKYFHTNATDDVATGISLLNRERIYLGEGAWRATAYLDDIAAINEKLNLITGDTDTDTLINNLKDLEEFLKDFSETDKLKSLLDGKLDKSGGTITSASGDLFAINRTSGNPQIRFESNGTLLGYIGYSSSGPVVRGTDSVYHNIIHSGNIGSQKVAGLATPVTIWGQSFDGTGNVSGKLTSVTGIDFDTNVYGIRIDDYGNVCFRTSASVEARDWSIRASNGTKLLLINNTGNVLIGTTTDNGFTLDVNGPMAVGSDGDSSIHFRRAGYNRFICTKSGGGAFAWRVNGSSTDAMILAANGDLHLKGNLIVDGEVSAGGAGAEEGTSGGGSAEGVSEIFTPTSTSMAFDHNLGEDVIVQVYEKSGNVWNMVIVDTEITSATRVTLRFGKTETTQHKVVIMGV